MASELPTPATIATPEEPKPVIAQEAPTEIMVEPTSEAVTTQEVQEAVVLEEAAPMVETPTIQATEEQEVVETPEVAAVVEPEAPEIQVAEGGDSLDDQPAPQEEAPIVAATDVEMIAAQMSSTSIEEAPVEAQEQPLDTPKTAPEEVHEPVARRTRRRRTTNKRSAPRPASGLRSSVTKRRRAPAASGLRMVTRSQVGPLELRNRPRVSYCEDPEIFA